MWLALYCECAKTKSCCGHGWIKEWVNGWWRLERLMFIRKSDVLLSLVSLLTACLHFCLTLYIKTNLCRQSIKWTENGGVQCLHECNTSQPVHMIKCVCKKWFGGWVFDTQIVFTNLTCSWQKWGWNFKSGFLNCLIYLMCIHRVHSITLLKMKSNNQKLQSLQQHKLMQSPDLGLHKLMQTKSWSLQVFVLDCIRLHIWTDTSWFV